MAWLNERFSVREAIYFPVLGCHVVPMVVLCDISMGLVQLWKNLNRGLRLNNLDTCTRLYILYGGPTGSAASRLVYISNMLHRSRVGPSRHYPNPPHEDDLNSTIALGLGS